MRIKNFQINSQVVSYVLTATLFIASTAGSIIYYQHEDIKQVCEIDIDSTNMFKGEDGKTYCYFEAGQHIITISRNDPYYHHSEEVEGYAIKAVEINSWRDNHKITYVNTVPVIVESTNEKNGELEFSNFGVIFPENNKTKNYTP